MTHDEAAHIEIGDRLTSLFDSPLLSQGEEVICSCLPSADACDDYAYFYQPSKQRQIGASLQGFVLMPTPAPTSTK